MGSSTTVDAAADDAAADDAAAADAATADVAWHSRDVQAALSDLDTTERGLSAAERSRRLAHYGSNDVAGRKPEPWWEELLESFTEPMQLLLIGVAVLTGVFGELRDALVIGGVVVVVAVLETFTELRSKRSIEALHELTAATARVVSDGEVTEVSAAGLVPGDVVVVEVGDLVPADARIITARGIRVDESSLTGEAQAVGKDDAPVAARSALAERASMLHSGTAVVAGEARAVVVATGARSELGRIGHLVQTTREPPTPLQRAMAELARTVLVVAVGASVLVPLVGIAAGNRWQDMLLSGLTLAFATIPEELPILVTVLLALGGRRLAGRGALLRRLRAGETLGTVTTIITDKTGTLTENRLRLVNVVGDRAETLSVALGTQDPGGTSREPLEAELAAAADAAGLAPVSGEPISAFPFDSTRKRVSRAWRRGDETWLAVSGAPEAVLECCDLTLREREQVATEVAGFARDGLRVVAFADRHVSAADLRDAAAAEQHLRYVGLVAFDDPLRAGAKDAVEDLASAGVSTIIVTGDHPATAAAVATRLGMPADELTGPDVDALDTPQLLARLHHGTVISRATPTTKHRVVQALQSRQEVVAAIGDGANDAPALAAADVGIAMGRRGADLARDSADIVLVDDAYPTVVVAVAAGRNITAQLRRAVAFYLGVKAALVLVLLVALLVGFPMPFEPVHIVLLEIFMDLGASVAFVAEPAAPDTMRRPPRPAGSRFFDPATVGATLAVALTLTLIVLPTYLLVAGAATIADARTAAVFAWLLGHVAIAWTLRARPGLPWRQNVGFPAWALAASATALLLALTPVGAVFNLIPLGGASLVTSLGLCVLGVLAAVGLRRALHLRERL